MFLRFPHMYFLFTMIGRMAIWVSPKFYDLLHELNKFIIHVVEGVSSGFGLFKKEEVQVEGRIPGERKCFGDGAEDVGQRGFDAVLLGHTHLQGTVEFADGLRYYNTGGWFSDPHCVAVHNGDIWFGSVADIVKSDPFPVPLVLDLDPDLRPELVPALAS
jgi:hypothetical protein